MPRGTLRCAVSQKYTYPNNVFFPQGSHVLDLWKEQNQGPSLVQNDSVRSQDVPLLPPRQWWGYRRGVSTQSYTLPTYSAGPGAQALSLNCNLNLPSSQASWGTTACCCFGSCLRPGPTLTIALALALGVPRPSSEESMELRPMTSQILTGKKGEDHHDIFMYGMELQKGIPG